jgi:hypothetical protein
MDLGMGGVLDGRGGDERENYLRRHGGAVLVCAVVGARAVLVLVPMPVTGSPGILMPVIAVRLLCVNGSCAYGLVVDLTVAQLAQDRLRKGGGQGEHQEQREQATEDHN